MFLKAEEMVYDNKVIEFNTNLTLVENIVATLLVHGVELVFD